MKHGLSIFLLVLTSVGWAGNKRPSPDRKVASSSGVLSVNVRYGERITQFEVRNVGGAPTLSMMAGGEAPSSRTLSEKDFEDLLSRFEKLPVVKNVPAACYRSRVDIQWVLAGSKKVQSKSSCFGQATVTESAYIKFVNLLVSAR